MQAHFSALGRFWTTTLSCFPRRRRTLIIVVIQRLRTGPWPDERNCRLLYSYPCSLHICAHSLTASSRRAFLDCSCAITRVRYPDQRDSKRLGISLIVVWDELLRGRELGYLGSHVWKIQVWVGLSSFGPSPIAISIDTSIDVLIH